MERKKKKLTKMQFLAGKKILGMHPLFKGFSEDLKNFFASKFHLIRYKAGQEIVASGEAIEYIYFIQKGCIEMTKPAKEVGGMPTPLAVLHQNESIGLNEPELYHGQGKYSINATAINAVSLFQLPIGVFNQFIDEHPTWGSLLKENSILLKIGFIKQAAPFSGLPAQDLYSFSEEVEEVYLPEGHVLFRQDEIAEKCYLLCSGKIEIFLENNGESARRSLAVLEPPSILGETGLLMNAPRNASAITLKDSRLLMISKPLLFKVMGKQEETALALMNMASLRSRPMKKEKIEHFSLKTLEGEDEFTLKDPANSRYFRLTERGWFIWQQLDGTQSLRDITLAYFKQYQIFNPAVVADLIMDLDRAGFLMNQSGLSDVLSQPLGWHWRFFSAFRQVMEYRASFKGVDEWISKTYQKGVRFLYHPIAWVLFIILSLFGFFLFATNFGYAVELLQQVGKAKWWLLLLSIPSLMIIVVLHELAHAYTTKFFEKKVLAFGLGWFWVGPMAFCDTSDMWLSTPRRRMMVDLAGIFLHFIVAGAFSMISVFFENPHLALFFWYMALLNYLMIFENLNPIIELDGYYALMDGLNHPNLKQDAIQWAAGWPKTFSQIKAHKAALVYWLSCFIYLILELLLPWVVLRHLLQGFFGVSNPIWSLLISLLLVFFSGLGILAEIKKNRMGMRKSV